MDHIRPMRTGEPFLLGLAALGTAKLGAASWALLQPVVACLGTTGSWVAAHPLVAGVNTAGGVVVAHPLYKEHFT